MTDSGFSDLKRKLDESGILKPMNPSDRAWLGTGDQQERIIPLGTPDWTPEPRPIPEELTPNFDPVRHPKPATVFAPWAEQLDRATFDTLKELARGGIGTPDE